MLRVVMKIRPVAAFVLVAALTPAFAQDNADPLPQRPDGGWQGQRGGSDWGSGAMGRGTIGTVTDATGDHFTIRTEMGEIYTVHFSVNTRIMKQPPPRHDRDRATQAEGERTPPQPIKPADVKVGDVIAAGGEVDASAKSVGAVFIMLLDPERAKQMREMEANFGKTWLAGRVTAINDVKVTLQWGPNNLVRTFVADENTTFRKRRDPITLADIHLGDMARVEGSVKDGAFVATNVSVMSAPPNGGAIAGPENGQPPATPPQ